MLHLSHVCVPVACPIEHVESTSLQSHMDSGRTEGLNRLVHAFGRRYGENSRGRGRQCEPKRLCRCVDEFYDGIRKVVKRSSSLERIPALYELGATQAPTQTPSPPTATPTPVPTASPMATTAPLASQAATSERAAAPASGSLPAALPRTGGRPSPSGRGAGVRDWGVRGISGGPAWPCGRRGAAEAQALTAP